ncbi:hypothetical protein [Erythrobacter crassostreae]|uniref:Uncharacterized protein n=1 Tax=Erythrobacter crassostreae TaxID=2828328 RepID=A0A9X1F3N0_9SPHN|nr:hypothetical protein [Erythrobacter crassostrea]MBV7259696.1 hypothetical protein [Erythrobacter crassostrea]
MKYYSKTGIALSVATLMMTAACSNEPQAEAPADSKPVAAPPLAQSNQIEPKADIAPEAVTASKTEISSQKDIKQGDKPACLIEFAYEGYDPETLIWEGEKCANVKASLLDPKALRSLGKWKRLDEFAKSHVENLPDDKVLYVEGEFTASVYPVGTTRQSYEVTVAD